MKKSAPKSSPQQNAVNPIEEQISLMMLQQLQLERTIWLMANERGGEMVIDEAALSPLWMTKFNRVEGASQTLLRITASQLQEPTDSQIKRLADLLADKPEEATPQALLESGLSNYPPSYVVARLAPLVQCRDGKWVRAA